MRSQDNYPGDKRENFGSRNDFEDNRNFNDHTSYSGYDYDMQHMRNLNSDHNYYPEQYDEPREYYNGRYTEQPYYAHGNRQNNAPDNQRNEPYAYNSQRNNNYQQQQPRYDDRFSHQRPRDKREEYYRHPNQHNAPQNNEQPRGFDRLAEKIEGGWNRWINKDYGSHTPDSDFSW